MRLAVEMGKTLLVDGPASVVFLSGNVSVLGVELEVGEKTIMREGKRMAFEVEKKATFDLKLGVKASFEEVDGSTIPPTWKKALKEILSYTTSPVVVTVIGGVDSGKTSFCVYLANNVLKKGLKVAIIDGDLGQSDIGPPSTIGFCRVTAPIKDLFEMKAENAFFVGLTSPNRAIDLVLEGLTKLKKRILDVDVNFLIINTDGWVESEDATKYKIQLVKNLNPDIVVGIQQENELTTILTVLEEPKIFVIESPLMVRKRSREQRKILRELGYKKYLKEATLRLFHLNNVNIECPLLGKSLVPGQIEIIKNVLLEEKGAVGLLVTLQDVNGTFLGIGIFSKISHKKKTMIYTPVKEKVSTIQLGQIKLNKNGREIGQLNDLIQEKRLLQ
jgi:polynucleotide 5'-hydroxyl-kinase GRC3/NOL9